MRTLTYLLMAALLVGIGLSGCSTARSAFGRGEELEAAGKYEEAMYSYAEAFRNDPDAGEYRIRFFRARERAADLRYLQGTKLYDEGNYAAALAEFQAGLGIDPTQGRFEQLVERSRRLRDARQAFQEGRDFEKANKFKDANRLFNRALELEPGNSEYRTALARVLGMRKSRLDRFELNLKSARPITLKFRDARLKDVFAIVTRLSGINFIFDEGVKDQPVTVYLEDATFQQTLDLLTNMFKLGRKVANESTVIIYPKTPEKTKQYEDMTLRTFHLNYLEAKKAINLVRTLLQVRKIYVNEEANSIVVRDSPDVVDVVEKILDASDVPDAELVLDVEVLEVGDSDARTLGLLLSDYSVQMGAFNSAGKPMKSTLSTTTTSSSGTTDDSPVSQLIKIFSTSGYGAYATVPTATYNFGKTLARSEVLSNPKIRVKNREKAKFTVGKRIPITTSNTTNETVSVNVQYIDVGVKLNAEPTILRNNEIVIKLGLEVSQDTDRQTVGGEDNATTVVTIATRNLETVLSLKDGETSVIGGLIERNDSTGKNKIFLLSDIPLLGELLTNTDSSNRKSELVLAITPRLVRGVTVPQGDLASFASGREDEPALGRSLASFEQEPLFNGPPTAPPAASPLPTAQPATESPVSPAVPPPVEAAPAPEAGQAVMLQIGAPPSVASGEQFTLDVKLGPVSTLEKAPFVLGYDPALVEFVAVNEGEFLKRDGGATVFGSSVSPTTGSVTVNLGRGEGSAGVSGEGTLATLIFRAKKQGQAAFSLRDAGFSASNGGRIQLNTSGATVEIK